MTILANSPLVSLLMTVRNGEPFLAECVDSLLGQTMSDFECVIVDDGSTDGTPALLSRYAQQDSRIRVITIPPSGIQIALIAGSSGLRGQYVARMDADDVAIPSRFTTQVHYLNENPSVALFGSALTYIDRDGKFVSTVVYPSDSLSIRQRLQEGNCIAQNTVMMRRSAYEQVGGYRRMFPLCEDYDLWVRLSERFDLVNTTEPLVKYRLHPAQSSETSMVLAAICHLAVKLSAESRRNTGVDCFGDRDACDRAALLSRGLTDADIDEATGHFLLYRLVALSSRLATRSSTSVEDFAKFFVSTSSATLSTKAAICRLLAKRQWRAGTFRSSFRYLFRALALDPHFPLRYLPRILRG